MGRPVKWSRDLHSIRERAESSKTETWSRQDVQHLFNIGPSSAQSLMKAVGDLQAVASAHYMERQALLAFLDEMIAAPSVEAALRNRLGNAEPPPRRRPLQVALPTDLRHAMMPDLPANITLEPGRIEVRAGSAAAMLESLVTLAMVMQNDLDRFQNAIEPPRTIETDDELRAMLDRMRNGTSDL